VSHLALVTLRPAESSDGDFLLALYASTRKQEVAAWGWPTPVQEAFLRGQATAQRASYAQQFPQALNAIIERAGRAIGRLMVDRSGGEIRLIDISLLPEERGKGVGTALVTALLGEAQIAGRAVRLHVTPDNPAQDLYVRLGFLVLDADPLYITMRWTPR
jgi:ribosomal protein S18 acetylase RimI-like enzyme